MKKIKLKSIEIKEGDFLTRSQLKTLMGGDDPGSGSGSFKKSDVPVKSGAYSSSSGSGCQDTRVCITSC